MNSGTHLRNKHNNKQALNSSHSKHISHQIFILTAVSKTEQTINSEQFKITRSFNKYC